MNKSHVCEFSLSLTGARAGDVIVASLDKNNMAGSSMLLLDDVPPLRSWLAALDDSAWARLTTALSGARGFGDMTSNQIREWLTTHSHDDAKETYLNDLPRIRVRNVTLSGKDVVKYLDEAEIARVATETSGDQSDWTIRDVYRVFVDSRSLSSPKDDGRVVLVFRYHLWALRVGLPHTYTGWYIDDTIKYGTVKASPSRSIYLTGDSPYAVIAPRGRQPVDKSTLIEHIAATFFRGDERDYRQCVALLSGARGGLYRSLMQKLVRSAPASVSFRGDIYRPDSCLAACFVSLVLHPGEFNEDLQIFVTGVESALKRAIVTVLEDSYYDDAMGLARVLGWALVLKTHKGEWHPSLDELSATLGILLGALESRRTFVYDLKETPTEPLDRPDSARWAVYALLRACGSFSTDIAMAGQIYQREWHSSVRESDSTPWTMPLEHAIDIHSNPDIGYCFDYASIEALRVVDFGDLSSRVWTGSSRYNPRKGHVAPDETRDDFVAALRVAQRRVAHYALPPARVNVARQAEREASLEGTIDERLVSGIVGARLVTARNNRKYLVSINPGDSDARVVMLNPHGRSEKTQGGLFTIGDDVRTYLVELFDAMLREGVKIAKHNVAGYEWLAGGTLRLGDGGFTLSLGGESRAWSDYLTPTVYATRLESDTSVSVDDAIRRVRGDGLEQDWAGRIRSLLSSVERDALIRLACSIANLSDVVEFPSVNRKGEATRYAARIRDVRSVELLTLVSAIVPSILTRTSPRHFRVHFLPFLGILGEMIDSIVATGTRATIGWAAISDGRGRRLMPHQAQIVSMLATRGRIKILCSDVGTGKTMCIFEDVRRCIAEGTMPRYCIYMTVDSGVETAQAEASCYGLATNILIPLKNNKMNMTLKSGVVNIVTYPRARLNGLGDLLMELAGDSYLVFDEFDTVLNPCKKTSLALDLSRRAYRAVCCTATPIKDRHAEYLIPWVSQIVPFVVKPSNLWTAIAAIIPGVVDLGIEVVDERVEASFTAEEEVEMALYAASATQGRVSPKLFARIVGVCYAACMREQIAQCLEWLNRGEVVFMVMRKESEMLEARGELEARGVARGELVCIGPRESRTTFLQGDESGVRVILTTVYHTRAYTATRAGVLIQGVYFVSEATRIQTLGRIKRATQTRKKIYNVVVHAGLLSQVLDRYDAERSMINAARSISDVVGGDLLSSWK